MANLFIWIILITSPLWLFIAGILLSVVIHFFIEKQRGRKLKGRIPAVKKRSFFKRLFLDFPSRLVIDIFNRDPLAFKEHGLHLFCGEQGSGKTTALVEMLIRWQQRYPSMKIYTNMAYIHEEGPLLHWRDILEKNNDIYGTTVVIDEIQTWFNSIESKDFPPEMLTEISQQRKQRKAIIGTAQVFSRVAKPIREQCSYVYMPMTFLGCLTIVRKTKAIFWDNEKQVFKRYIGTYFFVHSDKIREAFDTYKKISGFAKKGFSKRPVWMDGQAGGGATE